MKAMWRIFLILMIFFFGTVPFYAAWQQKDYGAVLEIAGPIALFVTALMMALAGRSIAAPYDYPQESVIIS